MKQDDQPKQQSTVSTTNRAYTWLLGSVITLLLLIVGALLILPQLVDSTSIKQKIQAAVTEQTGGRIDYQAIDLSFSPRLTIELHQVTLTMPDLAQATVAALRVCPEFLPLLTGDLHLARLELDTPQLNLELPDVNTKKAPAQPYTFAALQKSLATVLEPLVQVISGLELRVNNARLDIAQSKQKLVEIKGLSLQFGMSVTNPHSAQANLQTKLSEMSIYRNDHQETVKGISLSGSVQMVRGWMTVTLDRLALAEPTLELTGDLTLAQTAPAITLNLSGSNIDIDATRRTALALAGDTPPTKEIFDYLRSGRVPQVSFTSHGENLSELGDLNNILIEGQLQDGKVSIPELKLDLTEVIGDVVISKGVLQGSRLSTRLEGSTGRDGSLKMGLAKGNDLFQLELMLSADLAHTQSILQRVVGSPTFIVELEKITNLQGTALGRLTLGDNLSDINAKIEVSELKLSADSERVPLPITITQGQFAFSKEKIDLGKLSGTLGQSHFADLSCQFLWEKDLSLHISSGRFDLVMAELYPWLVSLEEARDQLKEVKQVTGRIQLSALELKGAFDKPSEWKFASTGTVQDLAVDTGLFPETINFASGGFKVDTQRLTFEKLQAASQDAEFTLNGSLKGFPQQLVRIDLSLDGHMGPQSVEWLSDTLGVPETYAVHAPLSISKAQISWQADSTASFKGLVFIEKGPMITADVDYHPEQLQVHQLTIKDQHSDASMVLGLKRDQHDFKFTGKLQHETLQALFVDRQFSSGRLEGNFAIIVPQTGHSMVTAKGELTGANLPILLSSGDKVNIDQVTLKADGPQVKVDITKLTWMGLTWEPVKATVSFDHDRADIRLSETKLCGIDSLGLFSFTSDGFSLDMTLEGKGLDVATSYTCLTNGQVKMTGTLDFSCQLTAQGQMNELVNVLQGPLETTFSNGVIEQDKLVSRTLEVLNVTEIVKGRLPDLASKGLAYTTMTLQSEFQNGKLIINKFFMDGETLDLIGNGEIRLKEETVDAQLLAAPFKTVDTVVKHIPGVNYLLAGSLVTIPVSITGALADPKVAVMSASAVSSSLYKLAERTIKSPFKLIEKINPWGKKNKK